MPTHNGLTPTGSTLKYTGPVSVSVGTERFFKAIAYKSGMIDSTPTTYDADNTGGGMAPIMGGAMSAQAMTMVTTTIYSVWDGDWAILEEYTTSNALVETYLQGYHGLVKTFVQNVYYYQDELGSTSHIADGIGALIESYQYDVYGKPRVYSASGVYQAGVTPVAKDLFTGQRWIVEIGLYDDRNRFMSPDLGRFLQPDPIGFKGDAANLYRYCGNDWANRTDPMGLAGEQPAQGLQGPDLTTKEISNQMRDWAAGSMMWDFEKRSDSSGGNGSRDGRAKSDASATETPKAEANASKSLQNGQGTRQQSQSNGDSPTQRKSPKWWNVASNYRRADKIFRQKLKHHQGTNDLDDALRHAEWSQQVASEEGRFYAWTWGVGHELQNLFIDGLPMKESRMDLHNNRVGRDSVGREIDRSKLIVLPNMELAPGENTY